MDPTIVALATAAATTVVQSMAKDLWSGLRDKVASLFGSDSSRIAGELETARDSVLQQQELGPIVEDEWRSRLQLHLLRNPEAVGELRAILEEVAPESVPSSIQNRIEGGVSGTAFMAHTIQGGAGNTTNTNYHQYGEATPQVNAQSEAELVQISPSYNGGSIELDITNHGSRPVRNVELVHIARAEAAPGESWKPNPNVWNLRTRWDILSPGQQQRTFVWLLDSRGKHLADHSQIQAVTYTVRFVDYQGQWWERTQDSSARKTTPPS